MQVLCYPAKLNGTLTAIPSKSAAHRLLLCAVLADQPSQIVMAEGYGEDIAATIACLRAMGVVIERSGDALTVAAPQQFSLNPHLDCHESGSTLRFLLPIVAALGCGASFTGCGRLPKRPIAPLVAALRQGGISIDSDTLPLFITGKLSGGHYCLPGNISSQFISGLLLALSLLAQGGQIDLDGALESAAYVEMTCAALASFGIEVQRDNGFTLPAGQKYQTPGRVAVEGDWSNMAFFLAGGVLGGEISCLGLARHSWQGDAAIAALLTSFGAQVKQGNDCISVAGGELLNAQKIDMRSIPDLLPILAVIASQAAGESHFYGAARLRLKESDRLASVTKMLRSLGGEVEEGADFLRIYGRQMLQGGIVSSEGDHRIAMAAAIAATVCRGSVLIEGAEAVNKSYPAFFADYQQVGGKCYVLNDR